jgi:hypothetical protein
MTKLEQSLADLCREDRLTAASLHYNSNVQIHSFGVYVHAPDLDGRCVYGEGKSLTDALGDAIGKVNVQRARHLSVEFPDEALVLP